MFTKVTYAVPKVILVSYNEICREMAMQEYLTPGGVLLGIFGGGVPHASLNPDPISDQKMPFSTPVFRPGLKNPYPFSDLTLKIYTRFQTLKVITLLTNLPQVVTNKALQLQIFTLHLRYAFKHSI